MGAARPGLDLAQTEIGQSKPLGDRVTVDRRKKRVAALLTAASLTLMPLESVTAHRYKVATSTGFNIKRKHFQGRIRSSKEFCRRVRVVSVWKVKPGPNKKIGTTRSRDGFWRLREDPKEGKRYYAYVKAKKKKRHRHSHRCKSGQSRTKKA
jgi:hypothetical protein